MNEGTPQEAALTGGAGPGAEPPPQARGRASSLAASAWTYIVLGLVLLITAAVADQGSEAAIGTALCGVVLLTTGAAALRGGFGTFLVAGLGLVAAVGMTILAFSEADFGYPELALLVAGAGSFIASFALLAAARRPGRGDEEPSPSVESA